MPFLNGNWNLIFPSFISIIAPIVLRKGLPRIIGHERLQSISRTIKSTGTQEASEKEANGKERAYKMTRVKWGRGKREANGK